MQKLNSIVKSTNVFKTSTAFQRTELLKKQLCPVLYSFCEYKLRNVTVQCYIVSVNTNEGVGLALWIWESENNLLGNPLCTKLCVFTAHHFEKLQCLLYLVDLEMDLSHCKLVHHHLDKMEKICMVPWESGYLDWSRTKESLKIPTHSWDCPVQQTAHSLGKCRHSQAVGHASLMELE